jgi:hypothetical protein
MTHIEDIDRILADGKYDAALMLFPSAIEEFADFLCVAKLIDIKSTIPEQHRSGKQQNSPRRA